MRDEVPAPSLKSLHILSKPWVDLRRRPPGIHQNKYAWISIKGQQFVACINDIALRYGSWWKSKHQALAGEPGYTVH